MSFISSSFYPSILCLYNVFESCMCPWKKRMTLDKKTKGKNSGILWIRNLRKISLRRWPKGWWMASSEDWMRKLVHQVCHASSSCAHLSVLWKDTGADDVHILPYLLLPVNNEHSSRRSEQYNIFSCFVKLKELRTTDLYLQCQRTKLFPFSFILCYSFTILTIIINKFFSCTLAYLNSPVLWELHIPSHSFTFFPLLFKDFLFSMVKMSLKLCIIYSVSLAAYSHWIQPLHSSPPLLFVCFISISSCFWLNKPYKGYTGCRIPPLILWVEGWNTYIR